ncbi:MAG: NAD-binding protein, partial [Oscillospiraceae bacterium]|nr:NAD-binding protein [Oscillospiraceae bacterium]
ADALLLSRVAKKVYLIHRRDTLRATKIYHEPLKNAENVELRWNSAVVELLSEEKLSGIRVKNLSVCFKQCPWRRGRCPHRPAFI